MSDSRPSDEQLRKLRRFAEIVLCDWKNFALDGGDIQDAAVECGLLEASEATEACGEECQCAEFGFPTDCYRKTEILTGEAR